MRKCRRDGRCTDAATAVNVCAKSYLRRTIRRTIRNPSLLQKSCKRAELAAGMKELRVILPASRLFAYARRSADVDINNLCSCPVLYAVCVPASCNDRIIRVPRSSALALCSASPKKCWYCSVHLCPPLPARPPPGRGLSQLSLAAGVLRF